LLWAFRARRLAKIFRWRKLPRAKAQTRNGEGRFELHAHRPATTLTPSFREFVGKRLRHRHAFGYRGEQVDWSDPTCKM